MNGPPRNGEAQGNTYREFLLLLALGISLLLVAYVVQYIGSAFVRFGPGESEPPTETILVCCMFIWLTGVCLAVVSAFAILVKTAARVLQCLRRKSVGDTRPTGLSERDASAGPHQHTNSGRVG